ncbi:EF hand domain containing protein [Acanthamoeba castellanii str. Neff]|uniref:EF hand domain containing protein n=1 Tax=Acanthamoeba castellanii (strain ATCC 30010 / Neff) TaxID=1257118 RepID=L8GZ65_ACACF|nr:EF hand domain containing protein [Acanthamoeba castellanii str. Neff]ELR17401.1 EF hand domain containing protein [Acanthamoeba castellanii str. Neff]
MKPSPAQYRRFERTKSVQLITVMRELFDLCDADGDGNIAASELRQVMDELGLQVGKEEFEQLFKELDTNNDKMISFGDFLSGLKWIQKSIRITASSGAVPVRKPPGSNGSSPAPASPGSASSSSSVPPGPRRLGRTRSVTQFIEETGGLSEGELAKMKKFFKECDEDQDGTVSKREMWNFLHKQGVEASKEEFISFFNELDDDQTGTLSFKQFVTGIQGLRKSVRKHGAHRLALATCPDHPGKAALTLADLVQQGVQQEEVGHVRELFSLCDKNGDGSIDMDELNAVFVELGIRATREEVASLFQKLAGNRRVITYDEFLNGMQWLNKGVVLSNALEQQAGAPAKREEAQKRIAELEKTNEVLRSYLQEFVGKVAMRADKECKTQHPKTAAMLLELLDYPLIRQMEGFVGGKLTTPESDEAITSTQRQLAAAGRKK